MIKWIAVALLATVGSACAKSNEPAQGSQTHFLDTCETSCPAPYECLCGACTVACSDSAECAGEADEATCVAAPSSCGASDRACDVACTGDDQCVPLGAGFSCEQGRCRSLPAPALSDAGATLDEAATAADVPELDELCDGSTDVRFGFTTESAHNADEFDWPSSPYGQAYFFVDGQCNYYASADPQYGVVTGKLSSTEAAQLAELIYWDEIEALAAVNERNDCESTNMQYLWAPGHVVVPCLCNCFTETPLGDAKWQAFIGAREFLDARTTPGMPTTGEQIGTAVLALANATEAPVDGEPVWPLDRPMSDVAGLFLENWAGRMTTMAAVDDPDEATALRALRVPASAEQYVRVQEAGIVYLLYMRDAFPEGVEDKIAAMRAQPKTFCLNDHTYEQKVGLFECGDRRVHRKETATCATPRDCVEDSDCAEGESCYCDESNGFSTCLPANCHTDADCDDGICAFAHDACFMYGFFCESAQDECVAGTSACAYRPGNDHFTNGASSCD